MRNSCCRLEVYIPAADNNNNNNKKKLLEEEDNVYSLSASFSTSNHLRSC